METVEGAEAVLRFEEGKVLKERIRKNYRHPELDERIRTERTEQELRTMKAARQNGVNVPEIKKKSEFILEIERVEGKQLKDIPDQRYFEELGRNVSKMHDADIIHGDLTTRNIMVSEEDGVVIIDFGLSERSERTEDKAVDIHLLKQVLESSHPEKAEKLWNSFEEGYRKSENYPEIIERLEEVEKRGRYK